MWQICSWYNAEKNWSWPENNPILYQFINITGKKRPKEERTLLSTT
jgi:hypothetical protein